MRYVDHMLRRLSYIGREKSVLKDLEKRLPDNLDELYSLMLSECQANRTEEQYTFDIEDELIGRSSR